MSAALVPAAPLASLAASGSTDPRPFVSGVHTIPYYDMANAVTENVWVETEVDGDKDGKLDRIYVRITRPDGKDKHPLIVAASPYYFKGSPTSWLNPYFVPMGYAFAFVSLPGTDYSTGCDDVGGELEVIGTKAIVDWANGRAKAYDADGKAVKADWSDGKVGMIGGSWDGTIANAVASTGVKGLETIVPIAAISSWYDYTRGNGIPFYSRYVRFLHQYVSNFDSPYCSKLTPILQHHSDDETGSYSKWWDPRNYRLDASKVTASVYVVHGLSDENVKGIQFGRWWDQLEKYGVDRKIFLHQGGHMDPISYGDEWRLRLKDWFDYYLMGLDNGVPDGPQATIQREDGSWTDEKVWPPADTKDVTMKLSQPLGRSAGGLSTAAVSEPDAKTVTFTQSKRRSDDSVVANPTDHRDDRAVFLSDKLDDAIRESGTASVTVRVKVDQKAAGLQARVVDYSGSSGYIVSRTIADVGHYDGLDHQEKLVPGKWYTLTWQINTDDRIFAAGHRLGVVLTAEMYNPTQKHPRVTATIDTTASSITMPLSGKVSGLTQIGPDTPVVTTSLTGVQAKQSRSEFMREFFEGTN